MASSDFCFNSSGIAIATSSTGWNKLTRSYDGYLESYDEWCSVVEVELWGIAIDWLAKLAFDASFDVVTFDEPPTEMVPGLNLVL
ncbi:hypothetical protein V6N13_125387 [Hibiscus sabdariffa]